MATPANIARYQILDKVGHGGMGVVYRARDTLLERVVALKVIGANIEGHPELRDRFFREARAAGQLSHRNIITIHDLGEHEGQPYLAMEYLTGEDLQHRLSRPEPMSLARKLEIAAEVCEGLSYAHRRGVIHRDIKPANIFITDEGVVKLLDFGLARMVTSELTASNMMLGTLNYMAPEQVRGERTDHRADIFSFGVVLYEILSGKKAFQGDSFATTLYKILQDVPEPLQNIDATLPLEVVRLVEKAIAKPRDERYQDLTEVARDLSLHRHHLSMADAETVTLSAAAARRVPSDPPRPGLPRPDSGQRPKSNPATDPTAPTMLTPVPEPSTLQAAGAPARSRVPMIAGALALLIILAGAAWFATRGRPESPPAAPSPAPSSAPSSAPSPAPAPLPAPLGDQRASVPPPPAPATSAAASPGASPNDAAVEEAHTRMLRTKTAARDAGPRAQQSPPYLGGLAAEREGLRLQKTGKLAEATAKFYEASGLFRSAEFAAAAQAARERERVAPPPAGAPQPQPQPQPQTPTQAVTPPPAAQSPPAQAKPPVPDTGSTAAPATKPAEEKPPAVPPALVPGPAPAPLPPATRPAPAASIPAENPRAAEDGVRELLRRYEQALEARSIDALKRVWPGLQGPQEDAIRKEFMYARRIDVTIEEPTIVVSGNTASVTFVRRYQISTVDGQRLPLISSRTAMTARRSGTDWVIDRLRFE